MAEIQIQKENRGLLLSHYSLEMVDFMGDPCSFRANSERDGNTRPSYLSSEKSVGRSRSQQFQPDMEQEAGSKLGKEYVKAVYCHSVYLTYMQSISCEMLGWKTHKLQSRLPGEISTTSDMKMIPLSWQKVKRN